MNSFLCVNALNLWYGVVYSQSLTPLPEEILCLSRFTKSLMENLRSSDVVFAVRGQTTGLLSLTAQRASKLLSVSNVLIEQTQTMCQLKRSGHDVNISHDARRSGGRSNWNQNFNYYVICYKQG